MLEDFPGSAAKHGNSSNGTLCTNLCLLCTFQPSVNCFSARWPSQILPPVSRSLASLPAVIRMSRLVQAPHPFYPVEANVIGYLANEYSVLQLLGLFALGCVGILGASLLLLNTYNPHLPIREKSSVLWFVLSMFAFFWIFAGTFFTALTICLCSWGYSFLF